MSVQLNSMTLQIQVAASKSLPGDGPWRMLTPQFMAKHFLTQCQWHEMKTWHTSIGKIKPMLEKTHFKFFLQFPANTLYKSMNNKNIPIAATELE